MKLGFLIPQSLPLLADETVTDPELLKKMPVLHQAVKEYKASVVTNGAKKKCATTATASNSRYINNVYTLWSR